MTQPLTAVAGGDIPLLRGATGTLDVVSDRLPAWRARVEAVGRSLEAAECWSGPAAANAAQAVLELSTGATAVSRAMADTPRSSALVENLNSRLRTYFTLRRHLGGSYLELLRFFLNHRRFLRSRHAERQGKSPRELLMGQAHPHWLTLLGLGELQPRRA